MLGAVGVALLVLGRELRGLAVGQLPLGDLWGTGRHTKFYDSPQDYNISTMMCAGIEEKNQLIND